MKHLTDAVERSLLSSNWYAALIVALSLPDIAGRIDDPQLDSGPRYAAWFDVFVSPAYTGQVGGDQRNWLSGDDCYALRCSVLHEGRYVTSHQKASDALDRFQFVAPQPGQMIHCNQVGKKLQIQVDVFCRDICKGISTWLESIPASDIDRHRRLAELAVIDLSGCGIRI